VCSGTAAPAGVDVHEVTFGVAPPAEWDSELLKALYELVFSSTDREVAGVLVGSPSGGRLPTRV